MTESEAKKKWCPFSRVVFSVKGHRSCFSANRIGDAPTPGSFCLGSGCMAWHEEGHCLLMGRAVSSTWEGRRLEAGKNA